MSLLQEPTEGSTEASAEDLAVEQVHGLVLPFSTISAQTIMNGLNQATLGESMS